MKHLIPKVFPSPSDFDNLSTVRTVSKTNTAEEIDYSTVVVNKPWGYEYLWFQNRHVAVWLLHLSEGASTSLHCHVRKKTSLIVLDGHVICSTLDDRYSFSVLGGIVLEPCVFHSTQAISKGGAFVIEVETPPMKNDLVRLKDSFGRTGTGYEGISEHSTEFSNYEYHKPGSGGSFRNVEYDFKSLAEKESAETIRSGWDLVVSFGGRLPLQSGRSLKTGEVAAASDLETSLVSRETGIVDMLFLRNK